MASKKTIGAGIALDGEKEFRQAVSAINSDLSVLKSEMKKVTSEFLDNSKSMESLTAQQEVVNKQIEAQTAKVDTLKAALENAKKEYGENSKQVQSWQIKLNNAEADLNKMNKELADIEKQASGIDKVNDELDELEEEADDAEDAIAGLNKDLKETKESGSSIGGILSSIGKVGGAAIGGAVTAASGLVTGFLALADGTKETQTAMSKLYHSFESAGLEADYANDSIYGLYGILGDTDRAVEASALLAKMSNDGEALEANMRILTGVFAEFVDSIPVEGLAEGMQATVAMGNVQGVLADALEWQGVNLDAYNEKLARLSSEEERTAYIQQTLTELYGESADAYRANNEALIEANEQQLRYEHYLSDIGAVATPVMDSIKGIGVSLLQDMVPGIKEAGNGLQSLLNGEEGAAESIGNGVNDIINSLLGELDDFLPMVTTVIAEVAPALLTSLATGLTDNLDLLLSSALTIIIELSQNLLNMLPKIIETGMEVITSLMFGIAEAIPEIMPTIIEVIAEIVSVLTDPENLSSLLEAALEIISELGYSLVDAIPQLVDSVIEIIENIVVFLTDPENLALIINCALDLIIALGTGLINAIPELITSVLEISASIWDSLLETDWGEVGTNIVDGLLEGLKTAWESLKKWFTDSFESLKTSVKDLFDIHSPSRWAKDEIMGNVMRGFGLGIEENEDDIKKQMSAFTATLTDDIEYDLNANVIAAQIAAAEPPADILAVTHSQATSSNDKFDRMLALLEIIAANSKKDILLDKKTLVGELTSDFDAELGDIYAMKERGA